MASLLFLYGFDHLDFLVNLLNEVIVDDNAINIVEKSHYIWGDIFKGSLSV